MSNDDKQTEAEKLKQDLIACAVADEVDRLDPELREWTQFSDPINF